MESNIIYLGIASGICTGISAVPQLYKVIKSRKAKGLSFIMLFILILGLSGWTWYGILKSDLPLIFTNGFGAIINILLLGFSLYYKMKTS